MKRFTLLQKEVPRPLTRATLPAAHVSDSPGGTDVIPTQTVIPKQTGQSSYTARRTSSMVMYSGSPLTYSQPGSPAPRVGAAARSGAGPRPPARGDAGRNPRTYAPLPEVILGSSSGECERDGVGVRPLRRPPGAMRPLPPWETRSGSTRSGPQPPASSALPTG